MFDFAFPLQMVKMRPKSIKNQWISRETKELSKLVKEMASINKHINNAMYNERYLAVRKLYRQKLKYEKRTFNDNRISSSKNINKTAWRVINENRQGGRNSLSVSHLYDPLSENVIISDTKTICNKLNKFFVDNTTQDT